MYANDTLAYARVAEKRGHSSKGSTAASPHPQGCRTSAPSSFLTESCLQYVLLIPSPVLCHCRCHQAWGAQRREPAASRAAGALVSLPVATNAHSAGGISLFVLLLSLLHLLPQILSPRAAGASTVWRGFSDFRAASRRPGAPHSRPQENHADQMHHAIGVCNIKSFVASLKGPAEVF